MSGRIYRVRVPLTAMFHCFDNLPEAIAQWASMRVVTPGAWVEVVETRRIVGHEELTDAGAASLAARVAHHSKNPMASPAILEQDVAMPRLGEYKPEVFANK